VVVGEGKGRTGLQHARHHLKHTRHSLAEVFECTPHIVIARQLVRVAGGQGRKFGMIGPGQPAQPYVAEVHQLGILNVPKVRRVGEDRVELHAVEADCRGISALQPHLFGFGLTRAVSAVADPFAVNGDLHFSITQAG